MNLCTRHYIDVDDSEKLVLLENARQVDQKISADEFIDLMENMLTTAFEMGLAEGKRK